VPIPVLTTQAVQRVPRKPVWRGIQGVHARFPLTQAVLSINLPCSAVPAYFFFHSGSTEPALRLPARTQGDTVKSSSEYVATYPW